MITQETLLEYRKTLLKELVSSEYRLFHTVGLISTIRQWVLDPNCPTAGISSKLDLILGQIITDYTSFKYCILHEVSHIPHMAGDSLIYVPANMIQYKDKKWLRRLLNVCMDVALNEFLKKMIPEEYNTIIKPREKEFATLESFDNIFPPLDDKDITKPNESAMYYSYLAFERMKDKIEKANGENCGEEGEGGTFDEHDWDKLSDEEKAHIRAKVKEAEEIGKNLAVKAGTESRDAPITVQKVKVPAHILNMLLKIKTTMSKILASYETVDDNFRKPRSREGFLLPTDTTDFEKEKVNQMVIVLDTSGSMFTTEVLSHSSSLALELIRRKKIAAAYCCDTQLKPINLNTPLNNLVGGGGTSLDNSHVSQIRTNLKIKDNVKLDIIYVTDGEVDLDEIKSNKNVKLHVIINKGELV